MYISIKKFNSVCTKAYNLKKILIIRFSSIGDIVLTTPVIRGIKMQLKDIELHYLTKIQYKSILQANPYIDKIHTITKSTDEIIEELKKEEFDYVIDLHKNLRSFTVKQRLHAKSISFPKLNFQKWLLVNFKINTLPNIHIVDRYLKTVKELGVGNDGKGLDYFIPEKDKINIDSLPLAFLEGFIGIVIGGQHSTKMFPAEKIIELINQLEKPIILLGGPEDKITAESICNTTQKIVLNACGNYNINQSASLVSLADKILTNDTGLMHIAAALKKEVVALWGNTIPQFGMYPYYPIEEFHKSVSIQVEGLKCRPCSKIGYKKCPKGHFDCMNKIDVHEIVKYLCQ